MSSYANPNNLNRYSYVTNNPLRYTDPTGHVVACNPMEDDCHDPDPAPSPAPGNGGGGGGGHCHNDPDCASGGGNNDGLDFTGYLASVLTARTKDPYFLGMQNSLFGISEWLGLLFVECPGCAWDIKLKIGALSQGIALCTGQRCEYYDYSTPGNIQLGYLVGLLALNKKIADGAGGLVNTFDVNRGVKDATYGGCPWCDDPRDQAAVDFGYDLGINPKYANGITKEQLAAELSNSPLTASFQPPPSGWTPPSASPGPAIFGPTYFDN